jgi:transcriptional regulator of nitric oxide reductase
MRRGLFILAVFVLMAVSAREAHAARFGTRDSPYQHLQDLNAKGPKGESLALGYVTTTHSFLMPYKLTSDYVLLVRGSGRDLNGRPLDVYHTLPQEKIAQMQRAGALPNPLPAYRHTIVDYLGATVLWWLLPVVLAFAAFFQKLGIGSPMRDETRSA